MAAIEAQAMEGGLTATTSIDIVSGPLEQVVIAPDPADIGIGMKQQFIAVGAHSETEASLQLGSVNGDRYRIPASVRAVAGTHGEEESA